MQLPLESMFIPYQDDATVLEAFVAYPDERKRPLVLLCHAWSGRDEFICAKAREMAELGYVGFALDMYGKGILGKSKTENASLKKPFVDNREMLQKRVLRAFEVARHLPYVDPQRIAVLGFGFGGICALDLVRSGADVKGAISVYGHLNPPPASLIKPSHAKLLILHGYQDPIVSQEEIKNFQEEVKDMDWQMNYYGNAMHAFATPSANDPEFGILYNPVAASRAEKAVHLFLKELFS